MTTANTEHVTRTISDQGDSAEPVSQKSKLKIAGIPALYFIVLLAVLLLATYTDNLPETLIVGFFAVMVVGGIIHWLGDQVPFLRDFGLATVLCILLPSILFSIGLFPENLSLLISDFTTSTGFLDFYVASLITGSILGMPRQLIIKAGARYAVPLIGTVLAVFAVIGGVAALIGFGFRDGILLVAGPVMGGGIGAGAVPMSEMYSAALGGTPTDYTSKIVPAIVVANTLAIIIAGIYGGVAKRGRQLWVGFNGEGNLVRAEGNVNTTNGQGAQANPNIKALATGLMLTGGLFLFGNLIESIVPQIHAYAWIILSAALIKVLGVLPESMENAVSDWFGFVSSALTSGLLVGVSLAYLDLTQLSVLLTDIRYLFLVLFTVVLASAFAGALGMLVKFYFIESSISVGLGMTDMGGTGDVAVVSASNRLELMPFLQVSSRLGGAFVLLLLSILLPVFV
jgi:Na+/citrate or Na+/malate symporter